MKKYVVKQQQGSWHSIFPAPGAVEALWRRDRWTQDLLKIMSVAVGAAALVITAGILAGVFTFQDSSDIYIFLAVILAAWLLSIRGYWRLGSFIPTISCFCLGVYGSYYAGTRSSLILIYVLAVLLAGILQGTVIRRLVLVASILVHSVLSVQVHEGLWLDILPGLIVFAFSMIGVSVLHSYFDRQLQKVLEDQVQGSETLKSEMARRQQVENDLAASEAQLRRLAENTTDLIIEMDPQGVIRYATPSYFVTLGYPPETLVGTNALDMLLPEERSKALEAMQAAIDTREFQRIQTFARHKNGHYLPFEIFGRTIYNPAGDLEGFVISSRDTSLRDSAKKALEESEKKFRTIIESIPLGIHVYQLGSDDSLIFTGYNPAANKILNSDLSPLVGKTIEQAFPGLVDTAVPDQYRSIAKIGGRLNNEQVVYANGKISGAFEINAFQTLPGSMVVLFEEITERLKAADALQQSEAKFSTAFKTSPDSVNINRLSDGVYLEVNNGFTRTMGYDLDEVIGKSSLELNIWKNPADRKRLVEGLLQRGEVDNLEAEFVRKNGDIGIGLMSARVIEINGEKCILSITRDITERYQAEIALREAHDQLETAYDATLRGWTLALELRERETAAHSHNVVALTVAMARRFGFTEEQQVHIERGALLHDIGKLGVPDAILLKPGPLTDEEWVIMRQHPNFARDWLEQIPYLHPAADIPYSHHERWDGGGYPRGLKGEEIPLSARIFSVVDVYDALLSNRPYRPAWRLKDVIVYLRDQRERQFDPLVVDMFLKMLENNQNLST